jgi:hypothetical protein
MRDILGTSVLVFAGALAAFSQAATVSPKWIGTWTADLKKSTLGPIWGPGLPEGVTPVSQTLKIEEISGQMKFSGDTALTGLQPVHDETSLNLDGKETVIGHGASVLFQKIDDSTFDIIVKVNGKDTGNHVGENRFVFSPDGKTLTETKTHTEREVVPEGADQTKGPLIRTSTSVLVFNKAL